MESIKCRILDTFEFWCNFMVWHSIRTLNTTRLSPTVDRTNSDTIVGTESCLRPDHFTAEFVPPSYNVHRRDRLDKRGGGVFLAVRNTLTSSTDPTLEVNAELLWCTISLEHQKSLAIGAFYRPPNTGAEVLDQLHLSPSRFARKQLQQSHHASWRL